MTDNVYLNRDRTKVVPAGSFEAKWQVSRKEAHDLGLLDSPDKPIQERRTDQARRSEPTAEAVPTAAPKRKYTKKA